MVIPAQRSESIAMCEEKRREGKKRGEEEKCVGGNYPEKCVHSCGLLAPLSAASEALSLVVSHASASRALPLVFSHTSEAFSGPLSAASSGLALGILACFRSLLISASICLFGIVLGDLHASRPLWRLHGTPSFALAETSTVVKDTTKRDIRRGEERRGEKGGTRREQGERKRG